MQQCIFPLILQGLLNDSDFNISNWKQKVIFNIFYSWWSVMRIQNPMNLLAGDYMQQGHMENYRLNKLQYMKSIGKGDGERSITHAETSIIQTIYQWGPQLTEESKAKENLVTGPVAKDMENDQL